MKMDIFFCFPFTDFQLRSVQGALFFMWTFSIFICSFPNTVCKESVLISESCLQLIYSHENKDFITPSSTKYLYTLSDYKKAFTDSILFYMEINCVISGFQKICKKQLDAEKYTFFLFFMDICTIVYLPLYRSSPCQFSARCFEHEQFLIIRLSM